MTGLNATHDPQRKSWVQSANAKDCDFPIQNLPYGAFSTSKGEVRIGVAIGDQIFDLTAAEAVGLIVPAKLRVFDTGDLNAFMALPQDVWSQTRAAIADLLDARTEPREDLLVAQSDVQMHLPFYVRSFTDFYASKEHATNVGTMFRGADAALMPNWLHMPIGYNGRASSVVVSGTDIVRPCGQVKTEDGPVFRPSQKLDIELELGAIVGTPSAMGTRLSVPEAYDAIFGYVILNDWSARDIQVWEYQPLGPFQGKAFASSISPWVVTREALEPFRCPTPVREVPLLSYLAQVRPDNFDIHLTVNLATKPDDAKCISKTNYKHMYYSAAQQLAHHSSSGCPMETGDLLGSGTISGSQKGSYGSLLELSWNGTEPIDLGGVTRSFLEDGDQVTLSGWCDGPYRVGFGSCVGLVKPASLP